MHFNIKYIFIWRSVPSTHNTFKILVDGICRREASVPPLVDVVKEGGKREVARCLESRVSTFVSLLDPCAHGARIC